MTLVLRYISDDNSDLYKLKRGKLNFLKSGPVESLSSKKLKLVILSDEHYVTSAINIDNLNFTPDHDQFLFSEKSILSSNDVLFTSPRKVKKNKTWEQVWLSASKLETLSSKIPGNQKFFPESIAVKRKQVDAFDQKSITTLDGIAVDLTKDFFEVKSNHKQKPRFFLILGMVFLSALPWLPYSSNFIFGTAEKIELFDNSIRTLDIFLDLGSALSLPDLKGIEFNQTNDFFRINTKEDLGPNKALRDQIVNFCKLALCAAEFDESLFTIRKSK